MSSTIGFMVIGGLYRYSLLTLLTAGIGLAQQIDGRIQGQVLDPTGAVVEGAEVIAEQTETGTLRRADSGPEGLYAVPALAPGAYTVSVSAEGFKTVRRRANSLGNWRPDRC